MTKILTIDGKNIKPLDKVKFNLERDLQDYLEKYPSIIPVEEIIENAPELICIGREVIVPSGSIDLMYIDKEGQITIVETKLVKNPDIRRTVIGQLIEYASFVSRWTASEIYEIASSYLKQTLTEKMANNVNSEFNEADFKHNIEDNLKNGKIRLIVAVDELNEPLRATVTFLNSNSNFDFLLLQISSFEESEGKRVLIPSLFGYAIKTSEKGTKRKAWDENRFFTDLEGSKEPKEKIVVIRQLYEFTKNKADEITWGTGVEYGSFTFKKLRRGIKTSIFTVYSSGLIQIQFGAMKSKEVKQAILESLRLNLNKIPNVKIDKDVVASNKYPSIKPEIITEAGFLKQFQDAVISLCKQIDSKESQS